VTKSGHATRVRGYKYFKQLSFLNNYFQERETQAEAEAEDDNRKISWRQTTRIHNHK
jgi:hypothetical protein